MFVLLLLCIFCSFGEGLTMDMNPREQFVNDVIELPCESDADCEFTVKGSSCVNKTCECRAGFALNAGMSSCVKVAAGYGEPCVESIQCSRYLFSGGICMDSICVCSEGYYYMHGRCNAYSGLFGSCKKDEDCYVIGDYEATSCVKGVCRCSEGYYQREHRTCRYAAKDADDKCVLDIDCQQFGNKTAVECDIDYQCVDSQITNMNPTFLRNKNVHDEGDGKISTYESDFIIGVNCTTNENCTNFGNATCDVTGNCVCNRGNYYERYVGKCIKELGEACNDTDYAMIPYSVCRNGVWRCERQRVASNNNRMCYKVIKTYNNFCLRDIQCYAFGPDAICQKNFCVCNEKSRFNDAKKFCWTKRGIGERCVENYDCFVDGMQTNLTCSNNVCTCPKGTHANKNGTDCISSKAEITWKCEEDKDCATLYSKCEKGVCACKENYYVSNNKCIAGIGANCTSDNECGPEHSVCFLPENKCFCSFPSYVNSSISTCLKVRRLGESCEEDVQCSGAIIGAICAGPDDKSRRVCACAEGHHYKYYRCFKTRVLGQTCKNLGECYVKPGGRSVCKNSICKCDSDYVQRDIITCTKSHGDALKTSLITLMPIIFTMLKYSF